MDTIIQTISIILSVVLVTVILLQVKGTGAGFFGGAYATFRTRRGFERLLFRATIVLTFVFIVVSIVSARVI